jgi:hypothetical protein
MTGSVVIVRPTTSVVIRRSPETARVVVKALIPGPKGADGDPGPPGEPGLPGEPGTPAPLVTFNGRSGAVVPEAGDYDAFYDPLGAADAAQAASQPLDADLTAIAGLSTQAFGRSVLELANASAGRSLLGLGSAAVASVSDFDAAGAATAAYAAAVAASQPLDADLTEIAALATAPYGRSILTCADASAARTSLGLGTAATSAATDFDASGAASAAQAAAIAASQPRDSDLTAIAALSTTTFGRALLELLDAAAARTALGLGSAATQASSAFDAAGAAASAQAAAIAASQPLSSELTAVANLSGTTYGRGFLTLADAAAGRTKLALGTAAVAATGDFDAAGAAAAAQAASQPLDSDLTAIAALTTTSFGRGFLTYADAAAGRTGLGLGTLATLSTPLAGSNVTPDFVAQNIVTTGGISLGSHPATGAQLNFPKDYTVNFRNQADNGNLIAFGSDAGANSVYFGHSSSVATTAVRASTTVALQVNATQILGATAAGLSIGSIAGSFGSGSGAIVFQKNATTNVSTSPVGGYVTWVDTGAYKGRGTSGTVTTIGVADLEGFKDGPGNGHCPTCGSDFALEWVNHRRYGLLTVCVSCWVDEVLSDGRDRPWIVRHRTGPFMSDEAWAEHDAKEIAEAARVAEAEEQERLAQIELLHAVIAMGETIASRADTDS